MPPENSVLKVWLWEHLDHAYWNHLFNLCICSIWEETHSVGPAILKFTRLLLCSNKADPLFEVSMFMYFGVSRNSIIYIPLKYNLMDWRYKCIFCVSDSSVFRIDRFHLPYGLYGKSSQSGSNTCTYSQRFCAKWLLCCCFQEIGTNDTVQWQKFGDCGSIYTSIETASVLWVTHKTTYCALGLHTQVQMSAGDATCSTSCLRLLWHLEDLVDRGPTLFQP